jgi:hypothetical protein
MEFTMAAVNTDKILTTEVVNRFMHYFQGIKNRKYSIEQCWPWNGPILTTKYGYFSIKKLCYSAHRTSYFYHNNMINSELLVLHKPLICKSKACVNYNHLYLGTISDNAYDTVIDGTHYMHNCNGEKHHQAVFTNEEANKIRLEHFGFNFTYKELAKKYNVSIGCIKGICMNYHYKI